MLAELTLSINNDIAAFEETLERADIAMNYAINTYLVESRQEELDSITEAVSLDHPEGKASEGLVGKASRITKQVLKTLADTIRAIFAKIRAAIEDAKFKVMMKKAEKVAKENSKVKNKTVKAYDPSHELKVIAVYKDFLHKMEAKIKAGKTSDVVNQINLESVNYAKKMAAAKIAAAVTVTVGAAIVMINKFSEGFTVAKEKALIAGAEVKANVTEASNEFVQAVQRVQVELARATKDEANALSKAVTTAIQAVKDGIIGTTEIKTNDTTGKDVVKKAMESEEPVDINTLTDSIIKEAEANLSDDDTEALINTFEESYVDNDNFDPEAFLEKMEEKFGDEILVREENKTEVEFKDYDYKESVASYLVDSVLK